MAPTATVLPDRLEALKTRELLHGSHDDIERGMCVMEAVAWVAGEKHSYQPNCSCPVLGAFMVTWNDQIRDTATRTRLLMPLVERLVGSRSTKAVEQRRADIALDWLIRVDTARIMEMTPELKDHAAALRALPPLFTKGALKSAQPTIDAASAAAQNAAAARAAARDAAWDAAWAAAWAAARAAARDAAWAAVERAALALKKDVSGLTWQEAYDAAKPACVALFAPTRDTIERSALDLIDQMLAVTPESLAAEKGGAA